MKKSRILVVEDERVVAMDIKDMLESLGYEVAATVASAEEAVEQAKLLKPDLVLMDVQLKGPMDGIEASQLIRKRFDIPVVYLTGNSDSSTIERAKMSEPFGFVLKPFEDKDIETAIEMAIYKHAAEKRIRQQERLLAATLRGIGDAVIATNQTGVITFMNPVAEMLTGWNEDEAKGQDLPKVAQIVDEESKRAFNPISKALLQKTIVSSANQSIIIHREGTETNVDHTAAPILDDRGDLAGSVLVLRDVSERKRAQEELFRREEQLRQARKMEAVGQLAGGIAHDFNNTLTAVLGYTELILRETDLPQSTRKRLAAIKSGAEHAAGLTSQLLSFSRKQVLQPRVLNLNDIVDKALVLLERLIKENVHIVESLDEQLATVKVDPNQIQQVIMNLVINAADAISTTGTITIETKNVHLDDKYAQLHISVEPGDYVMLAISDTGRGIEKSLQSRVFEPFFTTKDKSKGAGIGLATVYGIVKQSGGNVWVYSEPGVGSTFKVYLPIAGERVEAKPKSKPVFPGGKETILLVEDEDAVRAVTTEILEMSGYRVMAASNGAEGLKVCEQNGSAIDLLVTDVIMPNMNGKELAERALAINPDLSVLFMSGYTDDAISNQGIIDGNVHFIQKPFNNQKFLVKIREVMGHRVAA